MIVKKTATIAVTTSATSLESLFQTALGVSTRVLASNWDTVRLMVPANGTETVYYRRNAADDATMTDATTADFYISPGGMNQFSGTPAELWSLIASGNQNVIVEVGIGNSVTTDLSDDSIITVGSITATVNSDIESLNGITLVADNAAAPATDYPLPIGGESNTTLPTYAAGDRAEMQLDDRGRTVVSDNMGQAHVEYSDATYEYFCFAAPGSAVASAVWRVFRLTSADTTITWADGDDLYNNLATSLAVVQGLSYS